MFESNEDDSNLILHDLYALFHCCYYYHSYYIIISSATSFILKIKMD